MWQKLLGGRVRILVSFEEGVGFSIHTSSKTVVRVSQSWFFPKVFEEKEDVVGREVQIWEGSIQENFRG